VTEIETMADTMMVPDHEGSLMVEVGTMIEARAAGMTEARVAGMIEAAKADMTAAMMRIVDTMNVETWATETVSVHVTRSLHPDDHQQMISEAGTNGQAESRPQAAGAMMIVSHSLGEMTEVALEGALHQRRMIAEIRAGPTEVQVETAAQVLAETRELLLEGLDLDRGRRLGRRLLLQAEECAFTSITYPMTWTMAS